MHQNRAGTATLAIAFVGLASLVSATRAAAQNNNAISVNDFATGQRSSALTSTVPLRRGVTSRVTIVKDFIDLVTFGSISMTGGASISGLSNGRTQSSGMGFLAMDVTVPPGQNVGSTLTLKVGMHDVFKFNTVNRGEISSITKNPDPATIPAATPWTATIQGTDLGSVVSLSINCHTITYSGRTANAVTARLTRSAACTTSAYGVALRGGADNDPPSYNLAAGPDAGFQFAYAPGGIACVSQPTIGAPNIRQPQSNSVITFNAGTPSPASVTFVWDTVTSNSSTAPGNEWIVTRELPRGSTGIGLSVPMNARGESASLSFSVPGTHTVSIKAKNCGQSAPSTKVTFSTRY